MERRFASPAEAGECVWKLILFLPSSCIAIIILDKEHEPVDSAPAPTTTTTSHAPFNLSGMAGPENCIDNHLAYVIAEVGSRAAARVID